MDGTFKSLLEAMPYSILVHVKERILFANKACANLLGYEKPEEIYSLRSVAYFLKKQGSSKSASFYTRDGKTIDCTLEHFPINFQGNEADGIILKNKNEQSAEDIREIKEIEKEANSSRTRFLAAVSHEMRTPLNSLINLSHMLENTGLDKNQSELLEIAHNSAQELLDRVEDVLEFSQLESERIKPNLEPINVYNEVAPVIELLNVDAINKGIEFESSIDKKIDAQFMGCAASLRRVLRHLGENAIKYTHEGGVKIEVEFSKENNGINLTISDTGLGISPQRLSEIFDPFSFNVNPINRTSGGLSLGLGLSRAIVRAMGGEISLDHNVPHGIIAKVFLPFEIISNEEADDELVDYEPSLNILVAEDNMTNQKVVTLILNQLGHQVTTADDGAKCIETLKTQKFDLILMDLHMPNVDGYEAARRIRAEGNNIKIFALTADARQEAKDQAIEVGMDGFLTKPLMVGELHALLTGIIEDKFDNLSTRAA